MWFALSFVDIDLHGAVGMKNNAAVLQWMTSPSVHGRWLVTCLAGIQIILSASVLQYVTSGGWRQVSNGNSRANKNIKLITVASEMLRISPVVDFSKKDSFLKS